MVMREKEGIGVETLGLGWGWAGSDGIWGF